MIFLLCSLAQANPLLTAAQIEMSRALNELSLPDQPKPYWIGMELSEGRYHYATAKNGALFSYAEGDVQSVRCEVRVGSIEFDNGNFNASGAQGIISRSMPTEDHELALRQELWLGLDQAYKSAVEAYSEKEAAFEGRDYSKKMELLPAKTQTTEFYEPILLDDWTAAFATQLSAAFQEFSFLEDHQVALYSEEAAEHYINTEGFSISQPSSEILIRVEATARAADGSLNRTLRSWVISDRESLAPIEEYQSQLKDMALWLKTLEAAPIEEDYLGPVIFEEQASVELFRQLLQSQLSATPPPAEMPDFNGEIPVVIPKSRIGRRLLPDGWSVVDDAPAHPDKVGFYAFDDQGVPPQRVALIEDGVVNNLLMSRIPRKGFSESTGHGRGLGRDPLYAFPSVVEVSPSRHVSTAKMHRKALKMASQAGLDYVLVVKHIEPLSQTNMFEIAFSGSEQLSGLTLPTEIYRLYADGHAEPVRGASFVGVDRKVLRDIILAGEQSEFIGLKDDSSGRYGIGSISGMKVSWSAPSVLIGEMELRGQGGQEQRLVPRTEAQK